MPFNDYFEQPQNAKTLEEKIALINSSYKIAKSLRQELMKPVVGSSPISSNTIINKNVSFEEQIDPKVEEVTKHIINLDINNEDNEIILANIKSFFESVSNTFIEKVKLRIFKEILEYSRLLNDNLKENDILELIKTIDDLKAKLDLIDELNLTVNEEVIAASIDSHVFFLSTDNGNIYALDNLKKHVPLEYYDRFLGLFQSFKSEKLKGLQRLYNIPYFELKDFKVRILFDKIGNDFVIIDAFMKKFTTSLYYRRRMDICLKAYERKKKIYLENQTNLEFINYHEGIYQEVIQTLERNKNNERAI